MDRNIRRRTTTKRGGVFGEREAGRSGQSVLKRPGALRAPASSAKRKGSPSRIPSRTPSRTPSRPPLCAPTPSIAWPLSLSAANGRRVTAGLACSRALLHEENDFVALTKRFVNIVTANHTCRSDHFTFYGDKYNCCGDHISLVTATTVIVVMTISLVTATVIAVVTFSLVTATTVIVVVTISLLRRQL